MRGPGGWGTELEVTVCDGDVVRLALRGDLTIDSTAIVREAVPVTVTGGRISLDMAGVDFIDSTGLSLLLELSRQHALEVARVPPNIIRMLRITGLDRVLDWSPLVPREGS